MSDGNMERVMIKEVMSIKPVPEVSDESEVSVDVSDSQSDSESDVYGL